MPYRAAQRAIEKKAPFRRDKNAIADALIIETYAECLREKSPGVRWAFITHNKNDFSVENGNQKVPHPDFADLFSRIRSLYFINLPEALRRVEPSLAHIMLEQSWTQEPRGLTAILEAEDLLVNEVRQDRHWGRKIGIREGRIRLVKKEIYPRPSEGPETIQRDVWKGALESARRVERRFGKGNLGPCGLLRMGHD